MELARNSMRLVYFAAGAAGMICGSCLRDNRLVATLRRQGRDALLVPLYTPIRTDEVDVSEQRVLFGGINVYLQQVAGLFRYTPRFLDRLFDARGLFDRIGERASQTTPAQLGPLTISVLRGEHGNQRKEVEKVVEVVRELRPDIVNLPNLLLIGLARRLKEALRVPVICTLSGEDIFLDALREPYRSEAFSLIRERAADIDGFVSLTRYYAAHCVKHFGLDPARVDYVPIGIALEDFASLAAARAGAEKDEPCARAQAFAPQPDAEGDAVAARCFTVGFLARICPEKGLHNLIAAQKLLHDQGRPLRVIAGGWRGAGDRAYFERIMRQAPEAGLAAHFEYRGELARVDKLRLLSEIDLFSVPTDYAEAKGLSVLEAMAAGVPVVQPAHGSFPEFIETTGGGVLFPPGDTPALAATIADLIDNAARRVQLGRCGAAGVRAHHSDTTMADEAWRLYERFV